MAVAEKEPRKAPTSADKAKQERRDAHRRKRLSKLNELRTKAPLEFQMRLNPREAKELGVAADWKAFCTMKANAFHTYWTGRVTKPALSQKSLDRKKNRLAKLKELMGSLEKELGVS